MLAIGLTGGIGSGKTVASDHFAKLGVPVIDTDIIAREQVAPGQPALAEIASTFGPTILTDGHLNRRALRQLIFDQPGKRQQLEDILHPKIRKEVEKRLTTINTPWSIIVIPLLLESSQQNLAERILLLDTSPELQLSRTILRDNMTTEEVGKIMASQVSRQTRLELADDIIVNEDSLAQLRQQVEKMYQFYNRLTDSCQNH